MEASKPTRPAQCSQSMPPREMSQPPLAAPIAWPAYMADELRATDAAASDGAMPTSRACCAEFEEKHPSAQGMQTSAASHTVVPSGKAAMLTAISPTPIITERGAPMRSMYFDITMFPSRPKAPNHMKNRLSAPGVMASVALKEGAK